MSLEKFLGKSAQEFQETRGGSAEASGQMFSPWALLGNPSDSFAKY